jgi:uncharacterized protein
VAGFQLFLSDRIWVFGDTEGICPLSFVVIHVTELFCYWGRFLLRFGLILEVRSCFVEAAAIDTSKLVEICRRNDASMVALFGSMARGNATADSDVDLLVRFNRRKSLLALVRLERELTAALGRKVDLLTEASVSPYLRERIFSELRVLYEAG